MAPLPASSTPRFKVFYTNDSAQHSLQIRSSASPSALGAFVDALFTALNAMLPATTIDEVTWAPTGSDIFNPVTTGIEGNSYGSGGGALIGASEFLSFVGRTTGGKRCRLYVYGINAIASGDYRFNPLESTDVDSAIAVLRANSSLITAIDGLPVVWKSYANAGINAHWQKKLRP